MSRNCSSAAAAPALLHTPPHHPRPRPLAASSPLKRAPPAAAVQLSTTYVQMAKAVKKSPAKAAAPKAASPAKPAKASPKKVAKAKSPKKTKSPKGGKKAGGKKVRRLARASA